MSVHFSTIAGMPSTKTFSKKLGLMRQRFPQGKRMKIRAITGLAI
ncbi:hypothetical protein [Salinivibrio socompensis]|nr:hypothetical protein [Salinivibrio socompensis]